MELNSALKQPKRVEVVTIRAVWCPRVGVVTIGAE
jgi:hypothetical protein